MCLQKEKAGELAVQANRGASKRFVSFIIADRAKAGHAAAREENNFHQIKKTEKQKFERLRISKKSRARCKQWQATWLGGTAPQRGLPDTRRSRRYLVGTRRANLAAPVAAIKFRDVLVKYGTGHHQQR